MDDVIAKNLLLNHLCENCYYNDDLKFPYGYLIRDCNNEEYRNYRVNNTCKAWKNKDSATIGISSRGWG